MRLLTALLHVLQPIARLAGRLSCGLTPWRRRRPFVLARPWPHTYGMWFERWKSPADRLHGIEEALRRAGACVSRGGDFDRWDLQVRGGMLGSARLRMAVEEHGLGRQLVRFRIWPRPSAGGFVVAASFVALAVYAAFDSMWAAVSLGLVPIVVAARTIAECTAAIGDLRAPVLAERSTATRIGRRAEPATTAAWVQPLRDVGFGVEAIVIKARGLVRRRQTG